MDPTPRLSVSDDQTLVVQFTTFRLRLVRSREVFSIDTYKLSVLQFYLLCPSKHLTAPTTDCRENKELQAIKQSIKPSYTKFILP